MPSFDRPHESIEIREEHHPDRRAEHLTPCQQQCADFFEEIDPNGVWLELWYALTQRFGSERGSYDWLCTPHPELGNKKPIDVTHQESDAAKLLQLVKSGK